MSRCAVYNRDIDRYKRMSKNQISMEEEVWYLFINEETKGPIGLRDLDVLLRTNEINSRTLAWRNGMNEWKPLNEIEDIKDSIFESSKEMMEIEKKKQAFVSGTLDTAKLNDAGEAAVEDQMVENKDEDPLEILEVTVENLLKKTFHQNEQGKWSIYDEEVGDWVFQDEEPTEKIAIMKANLMSKLKNELFFNNKKKKHHEAEEHLTKQQLQKRERNKKKKIRAAEKKKQKWYHARINTFIYISGLPADITEEELKEFVCKAGVLRVDPKTGTEKLKLYRDQNGLPKGDAAVSYAREESVDIALEMLNERYIRDGFLVKIERAEFNQKAQDYIPRQSKKQQKLKKILAKKMEAKQLTWDEDVDEKGDGFKIVVIKHMFTPEQMNDPAQSEEIKQEITDEVSKIGKIKRIRFFEDHPDGVVEIKFEHDKDAEQCIAIMNGRFFDQRSLICEYWDGETDYKRDAASIALQQERLMLYASQLEDNNGHTPTNGLQIIPEDHKEHEQPKEANIIQQPEKTPNQQEASQKKVEEAGASNE